MCLTLRSSSPLASAVLPTMKETEYCMGIRAQIKPISGVYTASATPRIKPPPTHVAAQAQQAQIKQRSLYNLKKQTWIFLQQDYPLKASLHILGACTGVTF